MKGPLTPHPQASSWGAGGLCPLHLKGRAGCPVRLQRGLRGAARSPHRRPRVQEGSVPPRVRPVHRPRPGAPPAVLEGLLRGACALSVRCPGRLPPALSRSQTPRGGGRPGPLRVGAGRGGSGRPAYLWLQLARLGRSPCPRHRRACLLLTPSRLRAAGSVTALGCRCHLLVRGEVRS